MEWQNAREFAQLDLRLEKRLAPRRNTAIRAQIVFNGGRGKSDCIIRNLSDSGAKLEVATVGNIPQTFDLIAPRSPTASLPRDMARSQGTRRSVFELEATGVSGE